MKTLGIVHTSFALVALLNDLVKQRLPGWKIVNIVDDTLLPYAREHGVDLQLERRMRHYFLSAADAGADLILNACSSVGETVDAARSAVPVPIVKIDEAMAERAVHAGRRLAVVATVASTLGPTCRLLRAKAAAAGGPLQLKEHLCDGAFDLLLAGRSAEHDAIVTQAVIALAREHDAVVFAQASMSRIESVLAAQVAVPIFTSPGPAMDLLREVADAAPPAVT